MGRKVGRSFKAATQLSITNYECCKCKYMAQISNNYVEKKINEAPKSHRFSYIFNWKINWSLSPLLHKAEVTRTKSKIPSKISAYHIMHKTFFTKSSLKDAMRVKSYLSAAFLSSVQCSGLFQVNFCQIKKGLSVQIPQPLGSKPATSCSVVWMMARRRTRQEKDTWRPGPMLNTSSSDPR